jgi:hypothetical protein
MERFFIKAARQLHGFCLSKRYSKTTFLKQQKQPIYELLFYLYHLSFCVGTDCKSALSNRRHFRAIGFANPRYRSDDISAPSGFRHQASIP